MCCGQREIGLTSAQGSPSYPSGSPVMMLRPADVRVVRRLSAVDTYYKYGKQVTVGGLEIELVNE